MVREMGIGDARAWAKVMHKGQSRVGGETYFNHLSRVAALVECAGGDEEQIQIAWLHDIIEDTETSIDHLRVAGFSERVCIAVHHLSKRPRERWTTSHGAPMLVKYPDGETDRQYIARLMETGNSDALFVKRADLLDNAFDDKDRPGMWKRYERNLRLVAPDIFEDQP